MYPIAGRWANSSLIFTGPSAQKPWMVSASSQLADLHYVGAGAGAVCATRYRYVNGERIDNITDWAVAEFRRHYGDNLSLVKDDVFAYVYGVLHDPIYRDNHDIDLKHDFPKIPLYSNFTQWREWGQALLDLHMGYELAEPFPLVRTDVADEKVRATGQVPRVILKADSEKGNIVLDAETQLSGIPASAWLYRLGSRSAIEWVLDQHREHAPKDPVVREKFSTYRFADYKEETVDLLARVVTVSVKTIEITEAMRAAKR